MGSRDSSDKKLSNETHGLIAIEKLHHYGRFFEKLNKNLINFEKQLPKSSNIQNTVVSCINKHEEDIPLLDLLQSDNSNLTRILASLASVHLDIAYMVNEAKTKYYNKLIYYSEGKQMTKKISNLRVIAPFLDTIQQIHLLVKRLHQVGILLLKQLIAISSRELYAGTTISCFPEAIDAYAELLVCFVTFDALLESDIIRGHWYLYRRTVKAALMNPRMFRVTQQDMEHLSNILNELHSSLFSKTIIQQHINICLFENLPPELKTAGLSNEFTLYIQQLLLELERDDENIFIMQIWLHVNSLYVFQYHFFGSLDKKLLKRINDVNKKYCIMSLSDSVVWYPELFLVKHISPLSKLIDTKAFANNRGSQIMIRSQTLLKESQTVYVQACCFMIDLQQSMEQDTTRLKLEQLEANCSLIGQSLKLIKKMRELIKWIPNLHAAESKPMAKSTVLIICKLIQVLKGFQFIFHKWHLPLIQNLELVCQQLSHKALTHLSTAKKAMTQEKAYKEHHLDILSAIRLSERALQGPNTSTRILIARLALAAGGLHLDSLLEMRALLSRLDVMCTIQLILDRLCDCSFLYWHQVILPVYFTKLVDAKMDMSHVCYMLSAMGDCIGAAGNHMHKNVEDILATKLLNPLGQSVETSLRLQSHLHLQVVQFDSATPHSLVNLIPASLTSNYVNIKSEIEHYLSMMFYNLTTVVLHDWRTYGEMRHLGQLQFGLLTVEDQLPMQTLDQGLDVLEIMRNIHIFVGKYLYNLNNQIFIEETSTNKYLNTINISHVANSIRTHGTGIMNTTVNFTYQFLQKKFFIFSQFMFDEQIKSRLLKDLRFFTEQGDMYSYERAEKFNLGIKKLGMNGNGLSYLDLFRKLITHIGNAMGYVRLIRSGGRRCLADATCFIPDLKNVEEMCIALENEPFEGSTEKAAKCFKTDISNLVDNFEEATEYFKLLVKVFVPVFRNPQNIHLRNFFIIIPPLTINFVEHSLNCKERLNKQNKQDSSFTDDGFAMGLAYIIELLEQGSQFNSLHWFQSVKSKHANDRKLLKEQKLAASREETKLQQTLELTEKRINAYQREFQLLDYNFNSARIFFQ